MKRNLGVLYLTFALFLAPFARLVQGGQAKVAAHASRIKSNIMKRLSEGKNRVTLKLRAGSELKARLSQSGDNSFTATDEKSGRAIVLAYDEVQRIEGRGLSKGAKIGIIGSIAAGTTLLIILLSFQRIDPFRHGVLR